ncbi:MAG: DEAD/DEAH box helicase [Candidatus Competibacteraceae bacterium]|jgi:SNF2 family DNA or RNA helicase|nr:DEAD/DEAH box helicase [Candidatus Competibacteraceae bacterium]
MYIIHGTWIPKDTDDFIQSGAFYVWIETGSVQQTAPGYRLKYLAERELTEVLADEFKLAAAAYIKQHSRTCNLQLPGSGGHPLPSPELARWLGVTPPEDEALALIQHPVSAFPLLDVLQTLGNLHFLTTYLREDTQPGQDLLFWIHHAHALKSIVLKDQYIPALKYRELSGKHKGAQNFEIYPGWEIVSTEYQDQLQLALQQMPLACTTASEGQQPIQYDKEGLLRHFSECTLTQLITQTRLPAVFENKIRGTLLHDCLNAGQTQAVQKGASALERYRQWQSWQQALTVQYGDGFQLGFQLLDAADEGSPWQLNFVVSARQDPSLKLQLDDYWWLDPKARKALLNTFGADFERHLLLELGYAARMVPLLWRGLETDRPTGLTLTLEEAFAFLKEEAWVLEGAGFKIIVPAWWTPEGRQRAKIRLKASGKKIPAKADTGRSYFSMDALVKYRYEMAIGDQTVTPQEWQQLVDAKTPLVQFRGQWVELERDQMQRMLEFWQNHGQQDAELSLGELLQKAASAEDEVDVSQNSVLAEMLAKLQEPARFQPITDPPEIHGTLRDYQKRGVAWLQFLEEIGLNGCLADDMGLGKTLQVITRLATHRSQVRQPSLLVAPTSVLGNWQKEIEKFAPQLSTLIHHGSERQQTPADFKALCSERDLVITSFTLARKDAKLLQGIKWNRVIIDEAQNIKNPQTAQTKAILKLKARHRLALTGTPVENRLLDLWSIFNFLNPGYLGTQAQFRKQYELPIQKDNRLEQSTVLKKLVQPFILRRVKTDKAIIQDLPDKVEHKQYCNLTQEQASLYEAVVREAEREIEEAEGIQRKGLILSTLMRLKQICNHPRQFLQDNSPFTAERSHKLERLSEMLDEVIAAGESLLIFTQFTEIGEALDKHLKNLHYRTYYLHGGTARKRREQMIGAFQDPDSEPSAFILSLKAGGVGITLTQANHVFHFDRWWNPAVEDQATDRAFRIGQTRNVFVHKFVTLGTLEERIDQMLEDKKKVAELVVGSDESWLTELDNAGFKRLIALNRSTVLD